MESSDDETLAVVTLVGVVDEDAGPHRLAEAFPVRLVAGDVVLEPFALAGSLEVVVPATDPVEGDAEPVPSGEELVIVVPTGVAAPLLRLDEGETVVCGASEGTELTVLEGSPGQRCCVPPTRRDGGRRAHPDDGLHGVRRRLDLRRIRAVRSRLGAKRPETTVILDPRASLH